MTNADGFPTMTDCRCENDAHTGEGPRPDCREHGCRACLGRRREGHADGCLYRGPEDVPLSWILR